MALAMLRPTWPLLCLFLLCPAADCAADERVGEAATLPPPGSCESPDRLMAACGGLLEQVWPARPEWGAMLVAVLKGEALDPSKGWWRPSVGLYDWDWLRQSFDADGSGRVERRELPCAATWFERLDRDQDGEIAGADLEAGQENPAAALAAQLFRRLDADGNERVSWDELSWLFQQADRAKRGSITRADLEAVFTESPDERRREAMPSNGQLLGMLLTGQLGSLGAGPAIGAEAADFELPFLAEDGGFRLSSARGARPVVLIFGSFT